MLGSGWWITDKPDSLFFCAQTKSRRSSRNLKATTLLNVTTGQLMDDVYNFNLSGFDEPTIRLGIQECHPTKLEDTTNLLKTMNVGNDGKSTTQKKKGKKNRTNKNKQHLFSDTDTEYRGDDTKTDISWLRESNRKPKPQLIDYGRTRKQKKSKMLKADKSPMSSMREMSQQMKTKQKKIPVPKNQIVNEAETPPQPIRSKQPRRAALAKKNYKEVSDSETDSAEDTATPLIKKNTLKEHPEHKNIKNKHVNQLKVQQRIVSNEIAKEKLVNQGKTSTTSKDGMPGRQIELSPMASSESPASIEIMRSSGKGIEEESTQERISVRQSPLSSFGELTPEKEESIGNIEKIPVVIKINKDNAQLKQPIHTKPIGKKPVAKNESLSPILSPLSLPNFTPFTTSKTFASDHDEEIADPEDKMYDVNEADSIKNYPLDRSTDTELKDCSGNLMKNRREVSKSPSQLSIPSRSREELWHEVPLAQVHESGPTINPNFKRLYQNDTGSDSDEVEMRRKESKRKLLPRKLFKADDSTNKVSKSISTLSVNDTSVFDGEGWDADSSSVGMMCQNLHKEFARKIKCRSKRMDSFTKQSLKAAHQRMDTMRTELYEHRTQQLKDFHACLIKELENFEKDSLALKNTEKEFSMHLMKEDMKELEERLLKEMHEEELLNVRKGLQALFMAEDRKF
ncbi:hypothetical protein lerEdw1_002121 [Lerista edwardsae]|nr:hypothetical protein lerEdw1_002121 [Lerista edwardsae]